MSASAILYLVGMGLLFVGERLLEAYGAIRWVVDIVGIVGVGAAATLRFKRMRDTDDAGIHQGHRTALALTAVGAGSLLVYLLSTDATVGLLGYTGEATTRWKGSWGAIWPVIWLCGTVPMLVVDHALRNSPVVAPPKRIRQALNHGLAAALGIALVFPVNYIASNHDTRWDLAYFKTTDVGGATRSIVDSLKEPVHVYAFYPPTADVLPEIEGYFEKLEGEKLTFRRVDQTANPALARRLQIRQNGKIAFTREDIDPDKLEPGETEKPTKPPVVESIELDPTLDKARDALKKLDEKVKEKVIAVSQGERVVYLTTGHGEHQPSRSARQDERIRGFRSLLDLMSFKVEKIGLGEGLADGVPDDADLVVIIGPSDSFLDAEVTALEQYLDDGGSLLLAMEPDYTRSRNEMAGDDNLARLLEKMGVEMQQGVLTSEESIVPIAQNKTDRLNVVTSRFSSHPSTARLSNTSMVLFAPTSGLLRVREDSDANVTVTVRSRSDTWADTNENLTLDQDAGETKKDRPIVAVSTRGSAGETRAWRALVSADSTMFTDFALGNRANQRFAHDSINWLIGFDAGGGSTENEEDVKIRHTKKGQAAWFYGTVLGIPLLLLAAGAFRVWRRRKGGEA